MRIMLTGAAGQLGRNLITQLGGQHDLRAFRASQCDVTRLPAVRRCVAASRPQVVLHAAAMTAVDACEQQPGRAYEVNAIGSRNVALACAEADVRLIAFSTDFVFSGDSPRPYHETDPTGPINEYGRSKLAGEDFIRRHCLRYLIVRTAWLYGPGGDNFVETILSLARTNADTGEPVRVVDDQIGSPTSTAALARQIARLLDAPRTGTVHAVCHGRASRFELARAAVELAGVSAVVEPCSTAEYPRPAARPANSALDNRVLRREGLDVMPDWRDALREYIHQTR